MSSDLGHDKKGAADEENLVLLQVYAAQCGADTRLERHQFGEVSHLSAQSFGLFQPHMSSGDDMDLFDDVIRIQEFFDTLGFRGV